MRKLIVIGLLSVVASCTVACSSSTDEQTNVESDDLFFEDATGLTQEEISVHTCELCGKRAAHAIEGLGVENGGYDYEFLCDDCFNELNNEMNSRINSMLEDAVN